MEIILSIALIIVSLCIAEISSIVLKSNFFGFVLAYSFVFILSGFVTYTPDWEIYQRWVEYESGRGIFFTFLAGKVFSYGNEYGYGLIHIIFTGIYTFVLIFLISRFSKKTYLIVLLYIPLVYLFYTTQIRFFMGYFSICLAFYFWYVKKAIYLALALALFAVMNHSSLILILPMVYFFTIDINIVVRRVIYASIAIVVIYISAFNFLSKIPEGTLFINYLTSEESESSILGGLFYFLPLLFTLFLIYKYSISKIARFPSIKNDKNFQFLYRFSTAPFVFIGIAIKRQIIGHRFIVPSLLFQILLIFYLSKYNIKKENLILAGFTACYFFLCICYVYVLPLLLTINDAPVQRVVLMLSSNSILGYFR